MQLNNYFKLIITAGAPISWDRARWADIAWYYKKRTYLVNPPRNQGSHIHVTCPELTKSIHLMEDEALDSSQVSIPIEDVKYLVKNGEPSSKTMHPGWISPILCRMTTMSDMPQANKQRLLQANRDRLPSLRQIRMTLELSGLKIIETCYIKI